MSNTIFVYGPPGTGKTTYLAKQARRAAEAHGPNDVVIASLTRAAAAEIAGRDNGIPDDLVGTLHAHAYRALDRPKLAETAEGVKAWNEAHPANAITSSSSVLEDATLTGGDTAEAAGQNVHEQVQLHRARMTPVSEWTPDQVAHHDTWTDWKQQTGRQDFTDLIEACINEGGWHPAAPAALLLDEVQDFSKLELTLATQWAQGTGRNGTCVMVGDPDQCQPGETMIATAAGPVRFDHLDPVRHQILSFDRASSVILGKRRPFKYEKASRHYVGPLHTIRTFEGSSRCTPNHRWPIRWKQNSADLNVVYLMRRGDRWRIGWCQLFVADTGQLHLCRRANIEKADETWILSVHQSKRDASIAESVAAAEHGIPLAMFEPAHGTTHYDRAAIDEIFNALDQRDQLARAHRCLIAHGRSLLHPLLTREKQQAKNGRRNMPLVHAANLIPGAMLVAAARGDARGVDWLDFDLTTEHDWSGTVYSLDVQPHHTYIADGLVTGNCIYSFRGADPQALAAIHFDDTRALSQSYRVPAAVHHAARTWIRQITDRVDVPYQATSLHGETGRAGYSLRDNNRLLHTIQHELDEHPDRTVMVLVTCGYMLQPLIARLRADGIPFHNPYRATDGRWNPMRGANRLRQYLRADPRVWGEQARCWTWDDLRQWAEPLSAKTAFTRGAKTWIDRKCERDRYGESQRDEEVPMDQLADMLGADGFRHPAFRGDHRWWYTHLRAAEKKKADYAIRVLEQQGHQALGATPRLTVGSVHSVKGGESDVVILAPDLSPVGYWTGWKAPGQGRDQTTRLFYVGMTRAREKLTVLNPSGREYVTGLLDQAGVGEAIAA